MSLLVAVSTLLFDLHAVVTDVMFVEVSYKPVDYLLVGGNLNSYKWLCHQSTN